MLGHFNSNFVPKDEHWHALHDNRSLRELKFVEHFFHIVGAAKDFMIRSKLQEAQDELEPEVEDVFLEQEQSHDLEEGVPRDCRIFAKDRTYSAQRQNFRIYL